MGSLFAAMLGLPPLLGLALGFAKRWEFLWIGALGAILVAFAWLTVEGGDPANVYFKDGHDWMLLAAAWWLLSFYGGYAIGRVLRLIYDTAPEVRGSGTTERARRGSATAEPTQARTAAL